MYSNTGALIPWQQPTYQPIASTTPVYEDWRPAEKQSMPLVNYNPPGVPYVMPNPCAMLPTPSSEKKPGSRLGAGNPPRQYVTDGHTINDEVGNPLASLMALPNKKGVDIISMTGEPLLRYDKKSHSIRDMRADRTFAILSHRERCVYWGCNEYWESSNESTKSNVPKMYRYRCDESDGVSLFIWVYDGRDNRHIATITRLSSGCYPSRIAIQPDTPYHLLLCGLFLI